MAFGLIKPLLQHMGVTGYNSLLWREPARTWHCFSLPEYADVNACLLQPLPTGPWLAVQKLKHYLTWTALCLESCQTTSQLPLTTWPQPDCDTFEAQLRVSLSNQTRDACGTFNPRQLQLKTSRVGKGGGGRGISAWDHGITEKILCQARWIEWPDST